MDDLFKNLWEKAQCQKSGVCSLNPVSNALDIVIMNEIRQIAFYVVRLYELNFKNESVMKKAIEALGVNISDTSINRDIFLSMFLDLKNIKKNAKDFYIKKSIEMNISYEFITPAFSEDLENIDITALIKSGENIIRFFYNKLKGEKTRLISLIVSCCKLSAVLLSKLASYKEINPDYYFEILRLLALTNFIGTREGKFIRRIKEFSITSYKIMEELNCAREEKYGKRETCDVSTNVCIGKSILVAGNDLIELYNLLEKAPEINVYISPSMALACSYPAFKNFPNFKGIYGTGDIEFDFANFKGAIYLTKNSNAALDTAFRGKIFTTKLIPSDKAVKIELDNLSPLIEAALEGEGFENEIQGETFRFEYDLENVQKFIDENEDKKILISIGSEPKIGGYAVLKLDYPTETGALYFALSKIKNQNAAVYFSNCTPDTIETIITVLNKNLHKIYLKSCKTLSVSPHITEALQKDFNISVV